MEPLSPNINGKAKANNSYDAIVIGSGISGSWAANARSVAYFYGDNRKNGKLCSGSFEEWKLVSCQG